MSFGRTGVIGTCTFHSCLAIREKKYKKKATKMVDIFVLIVGVSELPKFTKFQLVIGNSKNI